MKNPYIQSRKLRQRGALFAGLALAVSAAHADEASDYFNRPFKAYVNLAVDGSPRTFLNEYLPAPVPGYYYGVMEGMNFLPDFSAFVGVDLGVLKVAQSTPAWNGVPGASFSANVNAAYRDTLTFTNPGGGMVPVTFSFAFDGSVSTGVPYGAGPYIQMAVAGSAGSVSTSSSPFNIYRDGLLASGGTFQACGNNSTYNADVCGVSNLHTFATNGYKVGTTTFTFNVLSGEPVNVWTTMGSGNTANSSNPHASVVDFSHTATLTSIGAPAGTGIASQLGGVLVAVNGGVTYQQAAAAAVPEPSTWALTLMGVGLLLTAVRKRAGGRTPKPEMSLFNPAR